MFQRALRVKALARRVARARSSVALVFLLGDLTGAGWSPEPTQPEALVFALIEQLFTPEADTHFDTNQDGRVTVADLVERIQALPFLALTPSATPSESVTPSPTPSATASPSETPTPTPTPSPSATASRTFSPTRTATPTVTPTPTITASPTISPTPDLCPPSPATLEIRLTPSLAEHASARARLHGRLLVPSCRHAPGWNTAYEEELGPGTLLLDNLHPGLWLHGIDVLEPPTGQVQYRRSLVIASPTYNRLDWRLYAETFVVRDPEDSLNAHSLRTGLLRAADAPKPYLIRFDDDVFPPGTETRIVLSSPLPPLDTSQVTMDGFDSEGQPGWRVIDANGQPFSALTVLGSGNRISGLTLQNAGGNNRDVLSIRGAGAYGNVIEHCRVQVAATADAIGIDDRAGRNFLLAPNIVRDSEVRAAFDKGIKVTTGATAVIERCWVHGNANGGIQATLGGRVWVRDSLIEGNGGQTAQNGLSANGAALETPDSPAWLIAQSTITRSNGGSGASVRAHSIAWIEHSALIANARDGLRIQEAGVRVPGVRATGSVFACNSSNGVVAEAASLADLGGGPSGSPGRNLFAWNRLPSPGPNLVWLGEGTLWAEANFWESCLGAGSCSAAQVRDRELRGRTTAVSLGEPALPAAAAPRLATARPNAAAAGEPVRVFGEHFLTRRISPNSLCQPAPARFDCMPDRDGLCVTVAGIPAQLEAMTPTMLVIRMPFSCAAPVPLVVRTTAGESEPLFLCQGL